jgi:hypothetical protein
LEYFRGTIKPPKYEPNKAGGNTVIIESLFENKKVDFSNSDNLESLAYVARKNANDLYALVMDKYHSVHTADLDNLEMLIGLISLASEIYMKCIIYYRKTNDGEQCRHGHNLHKYYSFLPEDIKAELRVIAPDFDSKLIIVSQYFETFRYSFEFNEITANMFAFDLAEKLHQICNNISIPTPQEIVVNSGKVIIRHEE